MKTWQFEALDSLFFRGAKPFNQGEGGFLNSQFPPTAQTMAGVIRSAIAEAKGVNWKVFREGKEKQISDLIGLDSDDPGKLTFAGPYLIKGGDRLYPIPLHLLHSSKENSWTKLKVSQKYLQTDRGEKRLPEVAKAIEGAKPVESGWLTEVQMLKVLQGGLPKDAPIKEDDVFVTESRTGIERDNKTKQVAEGALYFTRHIRLRNNVRLAIDVNGADDIQPAPMLRLGGEGRMAHVVVNGSVNHTLTHHGNDGKKAMIVLLTHADFGGQAQPNIDGIEVVSACAGKAVREGGWDYKKGKPKPLKSLVPAGSVFFVQGDVSKLGSHIGERTTFGYGEIAIGKWENKS